ncbi:MAG: hypothetical protein CMN37_07195 [SAR116 cluster bacterium]|nr:hypothetical protein [SAR116 cluster bacterium]
MKNLIHEKHSLKLLLILCFFIVLLRCIAVIVTPLELSADEAQYWLWSKNLSWGYFSKPPLIAWLISLSIYLFGDFEFAVRIFAPILHGATAIVLYFLAREFTTNHIAQLLSSLIWLTLPIVGVGSFIMSTDTPLMLFFSISILMIVKAHKSENKSSWLLAGIFSGLGLYAKYAAIYLPLGLILIYALSFYKKSKINLLQVLLFLISFISISIPNILWNFYNNFYTVSHLSSNAVIDSPSYSFLGSIIFITGQFIVVGPILLSIFFISLLNYKTQPKNITLILPFVLPVYFIMIFQGYFSEANANWAATALPGISIISGYYLSSRIKIATICLLTNAIICILIIVISITGNVSILNLKSDPLRKLKGWQSLSNDIVEIVEKGKSKIILVERRGVAAELFYYLRNHDIEIRVPQTSFSPANHYELKYSISKNESKKFYYLSENNDIPEKIKNSYEINKIAVSDNKITKGKSRTLYFYYLEKI